MAIALQAALFCGRLSSQLAVQEKQNKKKRKEKLVKLVGDGYLLAMNSTTELWNLTRQLLMKSLNARVNGNKEKKEQRRWLFGNWQGYPVRVE